MLNRTVTRNGWHVAAMMLVVAGLAITSCSRETTTLQNLMTAFDGESNANARYLAFAKKAAEEGYGKAASLFKAAARAEQVHFEEQAGVIKGLGGTPKADMTAPEVKSTKENLEASIKGELHETDEMYPGFLKKAGKDKNGEAMDVFDHAMKAEAVHAAWYKDALAALDTWKGQSKAFYVCPECGNVVDSTSGGNCSICGAPVSGFIQVE